MAENIYGEVGSGSDDLADAGGIATETGASSDGANRQQTRSPYKTQMMRSNIFLVVLFVGGAAAVYGLSLRKGPDEASAEQQIAEAQVDSAILRIASEDSTKVTTPSSGQVTGRVLKNFYDRIAERQIPLSDLKKNPFVFVPTAPVASLLVEGSLRPKATEKTPEEKRREETTAVLKTLHLQSVMMGRDGGTALISNNLLTVGQTIDGFEIKSISPRLVVLVRDGKEFVLEMP
ncbi:MAG: hypothetical protein K8R91_00785 [Phycisphaerae bacterium]|nr:hypothetical protein [Phycisphaerae bacterium]